jgi:hypothetical protein
MGMILKTGLTISFVAVLFIVWNFIKRKKPSVQKGNRSEIVISKAIVLSIEQTGFLVNDLPQISLLLQVFPEKGRNFVTQIKKTGSPDTIATIHAGSIIKVRYNTANTKEAFLIEPG